MYNRATLTHQLHSLIITYRNKLLTQYFQQTACDKKHFTQEFTLLREQSRVLSYIYMLAPCREPLVIKKKTFK